MVGLGGMFGSVASMAFAQSTGFILQATGSYWSLFLIATCIYPLALIVTHVLIPKTTPVEWQS